MCLVGHDRYPPLRGSRIALLVVSADADRPPRRPDDAREAAQRRGLAGAVGADQPEHFAGRHAERQVADRRDAAVRLREPLDLDHRAANLGKIRACGTHRAIVSMLIVNILINSEACMRDRSELALQLTDAVAAARAAVERAGDRAFRAYGLSHRAHAALNAVDESGPDGARPKDVAAALGVSRAAATTFIQRLELKGLVETTPDSRMIAACGWRSRARGPRWRPGG